MACSRTKLDPLTEHRDLNGWWRIMCPTCCYLSPFRSQDLDYARFRFWGEHDYRNKENTLLFSVPTSLSANEGPYWIIISDEGVSYHPHQHPTYKEAYEESVRLAKTKPGVKFNIFVYTGHTIAEHPKVEHRTYAATPPYVKISYNGGEVIGNPL